MNTFRKYLSVVLVGLILAPISSTFALTNKEAVLASVDSLRTSITSGISAREQLLSDRANELGNRYDAIIRTLGYKSDEIEALTSIKKLNVPAFRQEVAQAYSALKQSMFADIKTTQANLSSLRDEVALGYADLSVSQKQAYDTRIANSNTQYAIFLSGSTKDLDTFTETFSGRIMVNVDMVNKMMQDNGDYIRFIRDIRNGYAQIHEKSGVFLTKRDVFEKQVLPNIQWGFLTFTTNKKNYTNAIRSDLDGALTKALTNERLKKQETELRTYAETIMNRWTEYLNKNFSDDNDLLYAKRDAENIITTEKNLRERIYDTDGNIRSLDITESGSLLSDIHKTYASLVAITTSLDTITNSYGTGNTLSTLNDRLYKGYLSEVAIYRADFTKFLNDRYNTTLLSEKNHIQTLWLIDNEEQILKQNLATVTSALFTEQTINTFINKIESLAASDGLADTLKKVQLLKYKYRKLAIQKKIEEGGLSVYFWLRNSLDATITTFFTSLEQRMGREVLMSKFPVVSSKIDTILASTTLSQKKRYQLLVVQSNIFNYLENASK